MLVGRPRARSSRLREAIERLLIGSADQVLAELKRRAANGTTATKEDVAREAKRAADILAAAFDWARAQEFYELAYPARYGKGTKSANCSRSVVFTVGKASRTRAKSIPPSHSGTSLRSRALMCSTCPISGSISVGASTMGTYFVRADNAAEAINDHALAAWAKRKAMELGTNSGRAWMVRLTKIWVRHRF